MRVTMRKKYRTRCGTPVKILTTTYRDSSPRPVVALLRTPYGVDRLLFYHLNGKRFSSFGTSRLDLVEVVETGGINCV